MKGSNVFVLNEILAMLFGIHVSPKSKALKIKNIDDIKQNYRIIFMYNFIEAFTLIKELTLSKIKFNSLQIKLIQKNIVKMDHLHIIKLKNNKFQNSDFFYFLSAKNLTYLKITGSSIMTSNLSRFSDIIKSSRLENLL